MTSPQPGFWRVTLDAALSPLALARMHRRTARLLALYLTLCTAVLGAVVVALGAWQGQLRLMALGYVLPASWVLPVDLALDHLFASQQRVLVINALVGASLMAVSLLLFPVKEMVSASMETDTPLTDLPIQEPPLWEQGWQEVKLFVLFLAAQASIFCLGYLPSPAAKTAAKVLSFALLWFSFAVDFIAPIFQRHLGQYSQILKTLARHAPASLIFGALFTLPVTLVGVAWNANPQWSWTTALALLFGANVACIGWAAVSGTWLGSRMLAAFGRTPRSRPITRAAAWLAVIAALSANGYVYGAVALSAQRKSQLLKCDYSLDLGSIAVDTPGLAALLTDDLRVGVSADVTVHNPTRFVVDVEDNRVEIRHRGQVVARTALPEMRVEPGESVTRRLAWELSVAPSALAQGRALLDTSQWAVTMYVAVTDWFELPIFLLSPSARSPG